MIRVALDASRTQGGVAVADGDRVLAEITLGIQSRHAENALPALRTALGLAGVERGDIGAVVVGAGPGSFTGVRVAGATAKGLAAALDVPLLAYSSLLATVAGVPADRPVCALFDARRGEVYAGCWRVTSSSLTAVLDPWVGPIEGAAAAGREALFVGDGALRYRQRLEDAGATVADGAGAWPRASSLLWLAAHHPGAGAVEDAAAWEPAYVRASSAERGVAG